MRGDYARRLLYFSARRRARRRRDVNGGTHAVGDFFAAVPNVSS